ncbi:hypothetical protein EDD11_008378 [Mortierella claussenii]|nr:hypothetical protein EDD11_008378 [Mortierella claussenii]
MATAMGTPLLSSNSANSSGGPLLASASSAITAKAKRAAHAGSDSGSGTIRIFYSLKENPNAIISYTDLIRQEQRRQRAAQSQATQPSSKSGGPPTTSTSTVSTNNTIGTSSSTPGSQTTSTPLKNQKVIGTGSTGSKEGGATAQSSATAMEIDPPEGEEALGEGDSEAEDDDEADEDDEDNEDDAEAEDEDDDDEDPDDDDDDDDDPESGQTGPKDFLESLTEKYVGLEEGNEGEDEDEDEEDDDKGRVYKRPSRWDTEHYDIEDEFIDDSDMMLESIGVVRPKVDGFFAYRGPVETTVEDADSSDAGPRSRKTSKRKPTAGASPLSAVRGGSTKSSKASTLAVMENANDSTSEMSEMDEKPKTSKSTSASSGLAHSSTAATDATATETNVSSMTTTSTKKKTVASKAKGKDVTKDTEASKDSDKESKATTKKMKSKTTKTAATPIVRVESPPPFDDNTDNADNPSPQPVPSRSASPSRSKSKSKAPAMVEADTNDAVTSTTKDEAQEQASTQTSFVPETAKTDTPKLDVSKTQPESSITESSDTNKSKGSRTIEPLNEMVQEAYNIVAALARKETWEVKSKFPVHIKEPLWNCAKVALKTRSSGYILKDDFFIHLQEVLPYNKFTLRKLIYKQVLPEWIAELEKEKTKAIEMFSKRVKMISKSAKLVDMDVAASEKDADGDTAMNDDIKRKFPWTQDLRMLLWETMEKIMEIYYAKQELRTVDDSVPAQNTDSKTRKDAYQVLLASFPVGWMTSYEISRQYSQLKEKVQKQGKSEVTNNGIPIGKPKPILNTATGPRLTTSPSAARATGTSPSASTTPDRQTGPSSVSNTGTTPVLNTASSVTSPTLAASTHAPPSKVAATTVSKPTPSMDISVDSHRMASPSKSPAMAHHVPHVSEAAHPPSQQHSQRTAFASGSSTMDTSKKRKNPEEASVPSAMYNGTGPSHDPIYIDDEPVSRRGYRQNGGSAVEYTRPTSSSPSTASASQVYSSILANDAAKKKKVSDKRHAAPPMGHHHPGSAPGPYYQDYPSDYPEYQDYPEYRDYHPATAREPPAYSQRHPPSPSQTYAAHPSSSSSSSSTSATLASSRSYAALSRGAQQPHYQHHEPPQDSYYHRRVASPGAPPVGAGSYATPSRTLQRTPPPPPPLPSSASGPSPNAMSMSHLLHHPTHSHHSR